MKRTPFHIFLFLILILPLLGWGQGRIVFNNDASIVIENGGRVVIDNPNANAITDPSQGNLISEAENDMLKWNIGTNTGVYTLPYQDNSGQPLTFAMEILTAGSGSGHFLFSTYDGADWNNDNYRPSDVTHMDDLAGGSTNNSDFVIDRFWVVDAEGYSTKPEPEMSFGYPDHELQTNGGNAAVLTNELDLRAQRFNNTSNDWGDLLPIGSNPGPDPVQNVQVTPTDFYRSWTLVNKNNPLPVELLSFEALCHDGYRTLRWETASESNNDHFLLQRGQEIGDFHTIDTVQGAGTTPIGARYSVEDDAVQKDHYYRLVQVDRNGKADTLATIAASACAGAGGLEVAIGSNGGEKPFLLVRNHKRTTEARIRVFDARGKEVQQENAYLPHGTKRIALKEHLERGVYFVTLRSSTTFRSKKVLLRH